MTQWLTLSGIGTFTLARKYAFLNFDNNTQCRGGRFFKSRNCTKITLQVSKECRTSRRFDFLGVTTTSSSCSSSRGLSVRFTGRCSWGLCGLWTKGTGTLPAKLYLASWIIVIEAKFLQDIDGSPRNDQNYIFTTDICPLHSHIAIWLLLCV